CGSAESRVPMPAPPSAPIRLGMSPDEVRAATGAPDYTTSSQVKEEGLPVVRPVSDVWTYKKGRRIRFEPSPGSSAVEYFNGCVLTFQEGKLVSVDATANLLR